MMTSPERPYGLLGGLSLHNCDYTTPGPWLSGRTSALSPAVMTVRLNASGLVGCASGAPSPTVQVARTANTTTVATE